MNHKPWLYFDNDIDVINNNGVILNKLEMSEIIWPGLYFE